MIAAALKALAGWRGYAAAALVGALVAGPAAWTVQGWRYGAEIAGIQRDQAQQIADAQALARATEQARWSKREEIINDAKTQAAAAAADADRARAASERLRQQVSRLRAGPGDPAATGGGQGQSGADTLDLLVRLLSGLDDAGRDISGYADKIRIAGLACERAYESLLDHPASGAGG
ncbi:DUF2514 family protein [Castellaniella ginsengisoli]|uniref:DUF2514 family protein n=1 Tax=Castellaniella ginsengisoli TaxID=546114 RepID=A0AB39FZD9_9BURK